MKITTKQLTPDELTFADEQKLTQKQLAFLMAKTPAKYRREKPAKGGGKLTYVSGGYVTKVLNLMFGFDWSFTIQKHEFDLDIGHVVVHGRLDVPMGGVRVVKEQFGRADIKFYKDRTLPDGRRMPLDIGNDLKAAGTDALKKCASLLGVAADVYNAHEFTEIEVVETKIPDRTRQLIGYLDKCQNIDEIDMVHDQFTDTYGEMNPDETDIFKQYERKFTQQ